MALSWHTSGTFARRSPTSLVGCISVLPNAATYWSLVPELNNLVDGASKLQHQPFATLPAHLRSTLISRRQFRDGLKSHLFTGAYFWSSENICFKSVIYLLTYYKLTWDGVVEQPAGQCYIMWCNCDLFSLIIHHSYTYIKDPVLHKYTSCYFIYIFC